MKISDLWILNELNEKCRLMVLYNIDNDFYDYYMDNGVEWLITNSPKIEKDFFEHEHEFTFEILINCKYIDKTRTLKRVLAEGKEELSKYVRNGLYNSETLNYDLDEMYNKLIKFDDYNKTVYFEHIKR